MEGYYGFNNQDLLGYLGAGLTMQQLQQLQEILPQFSGMVNQNAIPQSSQQADYDLLRQLSSQGGGGPMGGANTLENISAGLDYLAGHPKGSKHQGFNPTNLLANFATGGLYGVGKGAMKAINTGKVGAGVADAAASYGLAGSVLQPTVGTENSLKLQALVSAGALGAAGPGAFSTSGFGAAAEGASPYYAGAGGVMDLGPGAMVGVDSAGNPLYQGATAFGKGAMTAEQASAAGIPSLTAGGIAGMSGGGDAGAALGVSAAKQGMDLLGGGSPLSMPQMGARPAGPFGGGGPSQAQLAAMGAQQSEAHRGLAPNFQNRMAGKQEQPGLANSQDLSLAALYGLGGGR